MVSARREGVSSGDGTHPSVHSAEQTAKPPSRLTAWPSPPHHVPHDQLPMPPRILDEQPVGVLSAGDHPGQIAARHRVSSSSPRRGPRPRSRDPPARPAGPAGRCRRGSRSWRAQRPPEAARLRPRPRLHLDLARGDPHHPAAPPGHDAPLLDPVGDVRQYPRLHRRGRSPRSTCTSVTRAPARQHSSAASTALLPAPMTTTSWRQWR